MRLEAKEYRNLFIRIPFFDDMDCVNIFLLRGTFTATATGRKIVFEPFRVHFFCQRAGVCPDEQPV